MDRPPSSSPLPRRHPDRRSFISLKSYTVAVQQYGTWWAGYAWQVWGCCTFRNWVNDERAKATMKTFFRRIERSIRCPVSSIAVLERRSSGCGNSATPLHWHFLMAAPPQHWSALLTSANRIWTNYYGDAKVDNYDANADAAYYLAKTAALGEIEYIAHNLEALTYLGPADITAQILANPYVPEHARHMTHGETLRLLWHVEGVDRVTEKSHKA